MGTNALPEHAVIIAGGGPTGLMLAAELGLAGARSLVLDRIPRGHPTSTSEKAA